MRAAGAALRAGPPLRCLVRSLRGDGDARAAAGDISGPLLPIAVIAAASRCHGEHDRHRGGQGDASYALDRADRRRGVGRPAGRAE
ncbi:MAG TPA: hypothetical protein VFY47_10810 [Thermoleophilaceae bacterium]|nr:hypothetical protein [Thermoleophilaceae bacterium]